MLIDRSTNGTCIATDEGKARLIKNESVALYGNGLLFLVGRSTANAGVAPASSRSEAPQQLAPDCRASYPSASANGP